MKLPAHIIRQSGPHRKPGHDYLDMLTNKFISESEIENYIKYHRMVNWYKWDTYKQLTKSLK